MINLIFIFYSVSDTVQGTDEMNHVVKARNEEIKTCICLIVMLNVTQGKIDKQNTSWLHNSSLGLTGISIGDVLLIENIQYLYLNLQNSYE